LKLIAEKLNANPYMDYYRSCVMNNFTRIDQNKAVSLENIALIRSISGLKAESGFFLTHVAINAKSKQMVDSVE